MAERKYDCSKTSDYLKVKLKICQNHNCEKCLFRKEYGNGGCFEAEANEPEKAIEIAQKYAEGSLCDESSFNEHTTEMV